MDSSVKSFGIIEGLFVVVVLGLLVLGGMWIMNKNDDTNSNSQQTTVIEEPDQPIDTGQPTEQPEGIDTSEWTVFDNDVYSIRIPDGWNVTTIVSAFVSDGDQQYQPGVPAKMASSSGLAGGRYDVNVGHRSGGATCGSGENVIESSLTFLGQSAVRCSGTRPSTTSDYPVEIYKVASPSGTNLEATFATHSEDGTTLLLTPERIEVIEAMLNTIQFK